METLAKERESFSIHFNSFPRSSIKNQKLWPSFDNWYAIVWLKKGAGKYFVDFKEYFFLENTIILFSKNQDICFEFSDNTSEYISITFDQDYLKTADEKILNLLSFCIREHIEGKQILQVNKEDQKYLENITQQLQDISSRWSGDLKKHSIFHFLQLFLTFCVDLTQKYKSDNFQGYTETVGRFTALLESNFRQTQKVNFYTDNLNLTYNSLSKLTINYCDKTPKDIIIERTILEIKRLLSGTKNPVKQIAYELGFGEPTNLVKYFKKYTGLTPSEFRKLR